MEALLILTTEDAQKIVGKTIRWDAKGYRGQSYGGVAVILKVDESERRPLTTRCIQGNNLDYAFNEWGAGNKLDEPICYSDGDRYIDYEIVGNA